jgi:hypothetical protein
MEQRHVDFSALAGAGARRSGSHARHGLPAAIRRIVAKTPRRARPALLGDDVEGDRARGQGRLEVAVLVEIGARSTPAEAVTQYVVEVSLPAKCRRSSTC